MYAVGNERSYYYHDLNRLALLITPGDEENIAVMLNFKNIFNRLYKNVDLVAIDNLVF